MQNNKMQNNSLFDIDVLKLKITDYLTDMETIYFLTIHNNNILLDKYKFKNYFEKFKIYFKLIFKFN